MSVLCKQENSTLQIQSTHPYFKLAEEYWSLIGLVTHLIMISESCYKIAQNLSKYLIASIKSLVYRKKAQGCLVLIS